MKSSEFRNARMAELVSAVTCRFLCELILSGQKKQKQKQLKFLRLFNSDLLREAAQSRGQQQPWGNLSRARIPGWGRKKTAPPGHKGRIVFGTWSIQQLCWTQSSDAFLTGFRRALLQEAFCLPELIHWYISDWEWALCLENVTIANTDKDTEASTYKTSSSR